MNELFETPPSKPSKLESARRALADAQIEYAAAIENGEEPLVVASYLRAVNRFTELVKAEEKAQLERTKK